MEPSAQTVRIQDIVNIAASKSIMYRALAHKGKLYRPQPL